MTLALLLLTLPGTAPLRADLAQAQFRAPVVVPVPVRSSRGFGPRSGIGNVVSGGILTGLGTAFGVLGAYALISAGNETGSTRTVFTALGWTSAGLGMILGAVGIPLLIVGIVQLSNPGLAALGVSEQGLLTVRF